MSSFAAKTGPKSQALLMALDQGLSSLSNFTVLIFGASTLSAQSFGKLATTMIVYALAVPAIQSFVSQELVLGSGELEERKRHCRDAVMAAGCCATAFASVLAAVAVVTPGMTGSLLILAIALPVLAVQDTLRYASSLIGRMGLAVFSDSLWLLLMALGAFAWPTQGRSMSVSDMLWIWAAAGVISGLAPLGVFFHRGFTGWSVRRYARRGFLGHRFLIEFLLVRSTGQVLGLILAALAGLEVAGAYRGATTLIGPLNVLVLSLISFGVPALRSIPVGSRPRVVVVGAALLSILCVLSVGSIMLIPDNVGSSILGQTWLNAREFVPAVGGQVLCSLNAAVLFAALRISKPRSTLRLRVAPALVTPFLFALGFVFAGPLGAVWGLTLGSALQLILAVKEYGCVRADPTLAGPVT